MDDAMDGKAKGTGFGKRASSSSAPDHVSETETDSDHEEVEIVETNNDRREALLTSNENEDLEQLKSGSLWESFENDFVFEPQIHSAQVSSSVCGFDIASGSTNRPLKAECKRKMPVSDDDIEVLPAPKAARISRSSVLDRRTGTTEHIQPALERSASLTPTTWACLVCTL
ncbi:hypothetical protein C0989_008920 [Termitomyces sp. Mn162]|nr:hypothetical protein C0989_008920 [Termitomyces sp. Mn162]